MRYRPDVVLVAISLGLLALVGVVFLLIAVGIVPGGIFTVELLAGLVFYILPLALTLAFSAAIVYFLDRKTARRDKAG